MQSIINNIDKREAEISTVKNLQLILKITNWSLYSLCGFICALFFSWVILAKADFAYPLLHDAFDISEHSAKYGPQNRYRNHFEKTDKPERIRLFAAINDAIHNDGKGLEAIKYQTSKGKTLGTLLRKPEVLHLQDVAILINVFEIVVLIAFILWAALIALSRYTPVSRPDVRQQSISIIGTTIFISIVVLIIGPVAVFYGLHELIFPANHQWFFYYQESLMTILMKAPDLFAGIAVLLVVLALVIFISLNSFVDEVLLKIDTENKHS